jgi:hypothetical protein
MEESIAHLAPRLTVAATIPVGGGLTYGKGGRKGVGSGCRSVEKGRAALAMADLAAAAMTTSTNPTSPLIESISSSMPPSCSAAPPPCYRRWHSQRRGRGWSGRCRRWCWDRAGGIVGMVEKVEKISLIRGLYCYLMICQIHLPCRIKTRVVWVRGIFRPVLNS